MTPPILSILRTANYLHSRMHSVCNKYGLTVGQYDVLRVLAAAENPLSMSAIKALITDSQQNVSRDVKKLLQRGLLSSVTSEVDTRVKQVIILEPGYDLYHTVTQDMDAAGLLEVPFNRETTTMAMNGIIQHIEALEEATTTLESAQ